MTVQYRVIQDLVLNHATRFPVATSLVDGDRRLTFSEVAQQVTVIAKALLAAGVKRGDRIATMAPPCADFWLQFLATSSIGAIWLGLNPKYRANDLEFVLRHAEPRVVFAPDALADQALVDGLARIVSGDTLMVATSTDVDGGMDEAEFLQQADNVSDSDLALALQKVQPTDTAAITYTSGTTGKPKGAMLSHAAILNSAARNAEWMGNALDGVVMGAPINHVGGLCNLSMNTFFHGGKIVFLRRVDMEDFLTLGESEKTTLLPLSHTVFGMLLDYPGFAFDRMSCGRLLIHGGSRTTLSYINTFNQLPARIAAIYGQTETCGVVTATRPHDSLEAHAESLGAPLSGVDVRLVDPDTGDVVSGTDPGELQVSCDFLFSGYFKDEGATAEAFTNDGYLKTGDICRLRDDGNFELVDRIKLMFKSGGYNVYPAEVETVIAEHEAVRDVAVLPIPDKRYNEVGCAIIACAEGKKVTEEELKQFLGERIANYKIPKRFVFVSALPTLPNLKVDRGTLAEQVATLVEAS